MTKKNFFCCVLYSSRFTQSNSGKKQMKPFLMVQIFWQLQTPPFQMIMMVEPLWRSSVYFVSDFFHLSTFTVLWLQVYSVISSRSHTNKVVRINHTVIHGVATKLQAPMVQLYSIHVFAQLHVFLQLQSNQILKEIKDFMKSGKLYFKKGKFNQHTSLSNICKI